MTTTTALNASDPYIAPDAINDTPGLVNAAGGTIFETRITAALATAASPIVSGTTNIHAETYNGAIPGPTFRLTVDDTVIVRLINDLPYPTGIHWHGIELTNSADGTPVTQDGALGAPLQTLGNGVPAGGTYLYKFTVTRPGIFWYHPHHFHSTNRVFRGLYGMIIVSNANEQSLVITPAQPANPLPAASNTIPLVLSDITVCKVPGSNDAATYSLPATPADAEWVGGAAAQGGPQPVALCETPLNEDGTTTPGATPLPAGDVPNIQKDAMGGIPVVEGQTVLTNGVNVGWRQGTPTTAGGDPGPGALDPSAFTLPVQRGQGLRLQAVNCAHLRYFRLLLTTAAGAPQPLARVGGEGGLLNRAVEEGGSNVGANNFDTKYDTGEILLPPAARADIVVVIPQLPAEAPDGSVMTLWTRDFPRTGGGFSNLPTVPVMHLVVNGDATPNLITGGDGLNSGTQLLASIPAPVEDLSALATTGSLIDPTNAAVFTGLGGVKPGAVHNPIALLAGGGTVGINGLDPADSTNLNFKVSGAFGATPYTSDPHIGSTRYAVHGDHLELQVRNASSAHHPFHLHGFSFQPVSLKANGALPADPPDYVWLYREFRDNVDVPSSQTLTFRVRLDDRALADEATAGGALGRWLFHCHIFFHAHQGMISELVAVDADGSEKPNVDVRGSWAYAALNANAERSGTYSHPDSDLMTLTATLGDGTPIGMLTTNGTLTPDTVPTPGGTWSWVHSSATALTEYVYITATDTLGTGTANPSGRKDQTVFRVKIGPPDDGSDIGDPHIHTVDGKRYDFQAVGEFTLLRDREGIEIQTRQTPVQTANPITDSYSGLTSSVSVNTAVAARVGSHRIAYQPLQDPSQLQFFVGGKPSQLSVEGISLDGHRVSAFDADGETGLRIDYTNGAVVTVTPRFWTSHSMWYMNVNVSHTQGDEGIMGRIPDSSWLPALPNGATVGPKPKTLHDRYVALYQVFANAWRVTDETSMFVYAQGTSTATFTDVDWPAETPPSILKPQFEIPGAPVLAGMPVADAELLCQGVTGALHADCVFDVATTGDEIFAKGYLFAQELRLHSSTVKISGDKVETRPAEPLVVTAIVLPLASGRPVPTGSATFIVDGVAAGSPVVVDEKGRAQLTLDQLGIGAHEIRAAYTSDVEEDGYRPSSSPNLLHTVVKDSGVPEVGRWPIWLWILLLLILIVIAWLYFS